MKSLLTKVLPIIFILSGCATVKTKRKIIDKYYHELIDLGFRAQFSYNNEKFEAIHPARIFGDSALKTISKKELKKLLKYYNDQIAIMPDSVHHSENGIDSFYINQSKISYLKKHYRKSNHVHFIRK